jgi:hypothetical protein
MITQTLQLNLVPKGISPRLYVTQYDYDSRTLTFEIYNGSNRFTLTSGTTAKIQGTKPDRHGFSYNAEVDTANNVITADITQQMTAVDGDVVVEIVLIKNNKRIGTLNFVMVVQPAGLNDDTDTSDTDIPAIIAEATEQMLTAEAYAKGTRNGTAVTSGQTGYHDNSKYYKEQAATQASNASTSATSANTNALKAEGYAVGKQNGTTQTSGTYYHNNAQYYKEQAASSATTASTKAGEASTSATSAAGSASTATTKAQEAAASAAAAAQSAAHLTIDSEMSTTSENALQNKVVTSSIQNLSNQVKYNTNNGVKNLFHFQSLAPSSYLNINWTFDGVENTIKMNSSSASTSGSYFVQKKLELDPSKQYVFKATFDSGINNGLWLTIVPSDGDTTYRKTISPSTPMIEYTPKAGVTKYHVYVYTNASMTYSNYNIANIMVVEKDEYNFNPSYEPYAEPNSVLTQKNTGLIDNQNVNGAVNMAPNNAVTQTASGATFTVNPDKTITQAGNVTATTTILLGTITLPKGTYTISDGIHDTQSIDAEERYVVYVVEGNTWIARSDGRDTLEQVFTLNADTTLSIRIRVYSGYGDGNTYKPMITVASYDGEYVPYAKSNKELTELTKVSNADYISTTYGIGLALTKVGRVITAQVIGDVIQAIVKGTTVYTLPEEARPYNYGLFVWITDQNTIESSSDHSVQLLTKGFINTDGKVITGAIANGAKARSQMVSYIAANDTPLS